MTVVPTTDTPSARAGANSNAPAEATALFGELLQLEGEVRSFVERLAPEAPSAGAPWAGRQASVRNLLAYLALRRRDLRSLQTRLARQGLSSLGRAEAHVRASLRAVVRALGALAGVEACEEAEAECDVTFDDGGQRLHEHAAELLGSSPSERATRIMVTAPSEAADNPKLVRDLLAAGMNCLRINCAHDEPGVWSRMIAHVRRAEQELGRPCRICMDLGGPKLRTGPLAELPGVLRVRPQRDAFGRVIAPARIRLALAGADGVSGGPVPSLPLVQASDLKYLRPGDELKLRDARGARRNLRVTQVDGGGVVAEVSRTCYFAAGLVLSRYGARAGAPGFSATVGPLPARPAELMLRSGDFLLLTRDLAPGRPARSNAAQGVSPVSPLLPADSLAELPAELSGLATIGCTLPEVFDCVRCGESIAFDDGKFWGVVRRTSAAWALVEITAAPPGGGRLRSDKGINLPETDLALSPLTEKDRKDLKFVVEHADLVALSFANRAADVRRLREEIERLGPRRPAIILKVETRRGFRNLPVMLLEALRGPGCGVMIARGDLAVECGFERLAEIQEEILWICEAAHAPVIWATQVLESLAKAGLPSRAEITDAAVSNRAECVMLNKGPHIVRAVQTLADILRRMQAHESKKRSMLRPLRLACEFSPE